MTERIDRQWIRDHAGSVLEIHINAGDRHVLVRRVVDRRTGQGIGLSYRDTSYKRSKRNGELGGRCIRTWIVGTFEVEQDLDRALEALDDVRRAELVAAEDDRR